MGVCKVPDVQISYSIVAEDDDNDVGERESGRVGDGKKGKRSFVLE